MVFKRYTILKIAGICGLLSTIILFLCIVLSVQLSPWFSWTENYLSEMAGSLGDRPIWAARGLSSIAWNFGIILAGLIGILFTIAIKKSQIFKTSWGSLTTLVLFVDMSALCGIGLFPITIGGMHTLNAVLFFALIPMLLFVIGYELNSLFGKRWFWITNIFCCISVSSIFIFIFTGAKAIAEMVALCALFAFFIILSIKFLSLKLEINDVENNISIPQ